MLSIGLISDANGCVNAATLYVVITGMTDLMADANISIFPNPSTGKFILEWKNNETRSEISIRVVNTLNEEVYTISERIASDQWKGEIDLSNLTTGIYFIELKNGDKLVRKKFVVAE